MRLFLAAETQWRYAGTSGMPVGLDYPAVQATAAMSGQRIGTAVFEDLRVMEAAAIGAFIEQARKR